jgi:hypothetical protein
MFAPFFIKIKSQSFFASFLKKTMHDGISPRKCMTLVMVARLRRGTRIRCTDEFLVFRGTAIVLKE